MDVSQHRSGREIIGEDEPLLLQEMLRILRGVHAHGDRRHRSFHSKQHGTVRAELIVEADLPAALRQGIFRLPRAYAALARFSNAKQHDDRLPDAHGVALKVFDVDGDKLLEHERHAETQDFIFIDHPVFFAKDLAELMPLLRDFQRLITGGLLAKGRAILEGAISPDPRYSRLRHTLSKRPHSPLHLQYWTTTPFRFGESAAKFSLRPKTIESAHGSLTAADQLKHAMMSQLEKGSAVFEFLVQVQTDPVSMPIEDATAAWDEIAAPFHKVATLVIPRQTFDTPERRAFGESLSFTPWHAIEEHRPLGSLNRARRQIYEEMSSLRQSALGVPRREPTRAEMESVFFRE